ncbi:Prat2 [Trypoxylus dichotomus]
MDQQYTSYREYKEKKGRDVDSGLTCECGVYVIVTNADPDCLEVSQMILFGLEALQHRGQESTGMVTSNGTVFHTNKSSAECTDIKG